MKKIAVKNKGRTKLRLLLMTLFFLFAVLPGASMAQKPLPELTAKTDQELSLEDAAGIFKQLPPEVREEIEEEAEEFHKECQAQSTYAMNHDCDCLAILFIDHRVIKGPDEPKQNIWQDIATECVNDAGTAGRSYENCMNMEMNKPEAEEYCTCFANKVAEKYKENPIANSAYMRKISVQSMQDCYSLHPRQQRKP